MRHSPLRAMIFIAAAWLLVQASAQAQEHNTDAGPAFSSDQLDQLAAPIALYPDSLVAQILMASTYPLEIVQAQRWREKNPDLEGKDLEQALASEQWDPSVKALTNFPDVLKRMSDNLDWTQDLGDAVLAQEQDVMDAVQHMRRMAYDEGNLQTTPEQKVVVEEKVIVVEPATEVVYVPAYSPTVVYGSAWAPATYYYPIYSYPPSYWYPPGYAASNIISFGLGMAVGAAIWGNWNWGHCDWRGGSVTINNDFNFNRNINTGNINIGNKVGGGRFSKWEHNPSHRGSVRYRDSSTRARFDQARRDGGRASRIGRDAARGFDRKGSRELARADSRDTRRSQAGQIRDGQRPISRDTKRSETRDTRDRSVRREATRPKTQDRTALSSRKTGAFDVGGSFDRAASKRGAASRSAGHQGRSLGGASRGGGGGRLRR
jgi:hypothetical protein